MTSKRVAELTLMLFYCQISSAYNLSPLRKVLNKQTLQCDGEVNECSPHLAQTGRKTLQWLHPPLKSPSGGSCSSLP